MSALGDHYWAGCAEGKILYQACVHCGQVQTYPRPFCHACGRSAPEWRASSKTGIVGAATTVYRAPSQEFAAIAPYRLLLVDMREGFRIMSHGDHDLNVGVAVTIDFLKVGDRHLPYAVKAT